MNAIWSAAVIHGAAISAGGGECCPAITWHENRFCDEMNTKDEIFLIKMFWHFHKRPDKYVSWPSEYVSVSETDVISLALTYLDG